MNLLKAYAELYEAEVSARVDAEAAKDLKAIEERSEQRYTHGYGTEVAIGRARVAALKATQTLNGACRDLEDKSAALAQAVGTEMESARGLRTLQALPRPKPEADARTIRDLIDASPAVEEAEENLSAAESALRRARGEYGPTLALTFQRDFLGQDPGSIAFANRHLAAADYRVGLQFSLPLFPLNAPNADVAKARAQLDKAQASYHLARLEAQTKLLGALSARREAERSFEAADSSLAEAEKVFALTHAQFRAGRDRAHQEIDRARQETKQWQQRHEAAERSYREAVQALEARCEASHRQLQTAEKEVARLLGKAAALETSLAKASARPRAKRASRSVGSSKAAKVKKPTK